MTDLKRHTLTLFNAVLAILSIHTGLHMIFRIGLFDSFPVEFMWLFEAWFVPGLIAILYGLCCFIASITAHLKLYQTSRVLSIIMLAAVLLQVLLLNSIFLITIQLIIAALLQYILSSRKDNTMKIKYTSFAHVVKLLLDLLFLIGLVFLIASPLLKNNSYEIFKSSPITYVFDSIFGILITTDLVMLYVLYELRKIFKSITAATPFIDANSQSLFRMGIASFLLALVFVLKLFVYQTILTYAMVLVLIVAGCFSFTLSALFKEATRVKKENDLTI